MKKIVTILSLLFVVSSCGTPVNNNVVITQPNKTNEVKKDSVSLKTGNFENAVHIVSGLVKLVSVDNKKQLSFENFKTESGPDLYIYLSEDIKGDAKSSKFIDLGKLTLNEGSFSVNIPNDVDITNSKSVVIWCKTFGVNFGYATFK